MHILVVNFQLKGIDEEQYRKVCEEEAQTFTSVPGLVSKVWLADAATNTYGGIYTWRDREAMDTYMKSDLFQAIVNDPHLADVTARDFAVLEGPTRVTRGLAATAV